MFEQESVAFQVRMMMVGQTPFVTEVATYNHDRTNMPAMIFGGKKLGMKVGQYTSGNFSINSYWGTIAQALGYTGGAPFASPIAGLWAAPT